MPYKSEARRMTLLNDAGLSWAAKGLGCHLTTTKDGVRFPNSVWDGTMDALAELSRAGYLLVTEIIDQELS